MPSLYGRLFFCGLFLSLASCGGDTPPTAGNPSMPNAVNPVVGPTLSAPCTGSNPGVSLIVPTSYATLSGKVVLWAKAIDNRAVAELRFYVDDKLVGIASAGTLELPWNTQTVPNGLHQVQARASNACQNQAFSEKVFVNIMNE